MKVPISFQTLHRMTDKNTLVDCGATDNFIHPRLIKRLGLGTRKLRTPRNIWNIDGTLNQLGVLTHFTDLEVQTGKEERKMRFYITELGAVDLILGYPWLAQFEPRFRWRDTVIDTEFLPIIIRSLDWRKALTQTTIASSLTQEAKEEILAELEEEYTIRGISTNLAIEAGQYTKEVKVPEEYQRHAKVFSEEESVTGLG